MANSFRGTPPQWILDTASGTPVSTDQLAIRYMIWIAPSAVAGNQLIVQDAAGKEIWNTKAPGSNFESDEIHFPDKGWYLNGLILNKIDAGVLYVFLR